MWSLTSRILACCLPMMGAIEEAVASSVSATSPPPSSYANHSEALSYYLAEVDSGLQAQCLVCHKEGGVAPQAGARLVLGRDAESNHDVFTQLLGSAETTQASTDADVIAFVERFYVVVLGRASDPTGLDGWFSALKAGTLSGGDVAEAFFLSTEYRNHNTSDEEFVETLYRAFFNRDSDAGGKRGWLAALQNGYSRADVINGFSGSAEFAALATSYGIKATKQDVEASEERGAVDSQWVLAKVVGQEGHGGGSVLTPASTLYKALETYLGMLEPLPTSDNKEPIWNLYDRERTDFIFDGIEKDNCPEPDVTYINEFIDVDRDGDSDILVGFKCFRQYYLGERPDGTWVKDQLTFDPWKGYVADSYLAVLINNDGEFEIDQSIFSGEYPVYDSSLTIQHAAVEDLNSDGYPDVLFRGHWDNSINMIINQYWFPHEPQRQFESLENGDQGWAMAQQSVMLSDGQGQYKIHELGMLDGTAGIFWMKDELGETYVWHVGELMTLRKEARELYSQSAFEFRPTVAKVTKSGDLIDVTDKYLITQYPDWMDYGYDEWSKDNFASRKETTWMCFTHNKPDLISSDNNNSRKPACDIPTNNFSQKHGQNHQGKFYADGLTPVNTFAATQGQYNPDAYHCFQFSGDQAQERAACWAEYFSELKQVPTVEIIEMNSERGLEVTHTSYTEVQFMLIDLPDGTQRLEKFTKVGDNWIMAFLSMGVRAHESLGETAVVNSITGVVLDPGVEPQDILEPYLATTEWLLESQNSYWEQRFWYYNEFEADSIYDTLNNAGICLDFIVSVEPEDCVNPASYISNWWLRGENSGAMSLSLGYVLKDRGLKNSEVFTGLQMPTEAQWEFVDIDNDGDADIHTHNGSYRLPDNALYINTDNQVVALSNSDFWLDVAWEDRESDYHEYVLKVTDDVANGGYFSDAEWFLSQKPKKPEFADVNGDGILDYAAIKGRNAANDDVSMGPYLEVIYGK